MSAKEFDELIKSKLSQPDFTYEEEDYAAMNAQLIAARQPKSSRKFFFWLTSIAASVALIVTISGLSHRAAYDRGESAAKEVNVTPATIPQAISVAASTSQNTKTGTENAGQNKDVAKHINNKRSSKFKNTPSLASNSTITDLINKEREEKNGIVVQNPGSGSPKNIQPIGNEAFLLSDIGSHPLHSMTSNSDIEPLIREYIKPDRRVDISLAGGVNYGPSSQGYLLGASVRKNLNNKLYIEGDVAYTNSTSQRTVNALSFSSAPPLNAAGVSTAPPPVSTQKENANSLNYLQVNPCVGYHIHKKIAVGIGPDFQRLLQNNTATTSAMTINNGTTSETGKIMPEMDYGIIGKTEFLVSSRLKAGFQYREGMNNFLSNTSKYFDRNYFQVQVKYSLFNK